MLYIVVRFGENSIFIDFSYLLFTVHYSRSSKPRNDSWLMTEYTVFWIGLNKRLIQFVNFYE